ncbi:MAG: hypothetical protein KatS3mg072_3025 [Meiothermus sp.]|nr:MAG: hypothetical protein KatS3mg072_3025 [Meiothermus sp.]
MNRTKTLFNMRVLPYIGDKNTVSNSQTSYLLATGLLQIAYYTGFKKIIIETKDPQRLSF